MILYLPGRRDLLVSRNLSHTCTKLVHSGVQGESGGINIELRLCNIRLILNGALWAFRRIDRPQSGNHTESETRSRDFPWVPSPINDPAAAAWMPNPPSRIMPFLLRHYGTLLVTDSRIFPTSCISRFHDWIQLCMLWKKDKKEPSNICKMRICNR